MNSSVMMTTAMEKAMVSCTTEFAQMVVKSLSEKYGFDESEALAHLALETVSVTRKTKAPKAAKAAKAAKAPKMPVPSLALPFCGVVMDNWCKGIRPNHELFTQCTMAPNKDGLYCSTCCTQATSNDSNKPNHGDIRDRMEGGDEWRTPAGKQPMNYGNVMAKRKIDKDAAIAEATAFGWEIPEAQFEVKSRKPGRPKSPSTSDTEEDETPVKKKRGRPSKQKALVSGDASDDFIGKLVSSVGDLSDTSGSDDESVGPSEETKEQTDDDAAPAETEKQTDDDAAAETEKQTDDDAAPAETEKQTDDDAAPAETEKQTDDDAAETKKEVKKVKKAKKVKVELTEEEKADKKKVAAEKRKATAAKKKAAKEAAAAAEAAAKAAEAVVEAENVSSSEDELSSQPDTDDEGEEVDTTEFEEGGVIYWRTAENKVYGGEEADPKEVGKWDEVNECIMFNKD
jgi:hypothetical protein